MKRAFFVAAAVIALALSSGSALAQTEKAEPTKYLRIPHRFQIFLEGGGAIPSKPGDFKEFWNAAFSFGIGAGVSILPWFEVNGGLQHMSFSNDGLKSKSVLRYSGINEVTGGTIHTNVYYGSARFLAVPKARTNPYVEVAFGYYKTSADRLEVKDVLANSMDPVSGFSVAPTVGIQHALNDYWSAYARYTYTLNLSNTFTPGDLLTPLTGTHTPSTGDQVIQAITVGLMVRF